MTTNLIDYFENLASSMESRNLTRRQTLKTESRVKRLINEFTVIKRPGDRTRGEHDTPGAYNTLPKRCKHPKMSQTDTSGTSTHTISESNTSTRNHTTRVRKAESRSYASAVLGKNVNDLQSVEEQVLQWGTQRRLARVQQEETSVRDNGEEPSTSRSDDDGLNTQYSRLQIANEDNITDDKTCQRNDEDNDDGMFELFDFEDNNNDNYILEAYNKVGNELVITTVQITRHTVTQSDSCENLEQMKEDADFVFQTVNDSGSRSVDTEANSSASDECEELITVKGTDEDQSEHCNGSDDMQADNYNYHTYPYFDPEFDDGSDEEEEDEDAFIPDSFDNNENLETPNMNTGSSRDESKNEQLPVLYYANIDETDHTLPKKKEKEVYVVEELIKTEEMYAAGLKFVVEKYLPFMEVYTTPDLLGKTSYVFGNIIEIAKGAQKFLEKIKKSSGTPESIAQAFIDSASTFQLYPMYSKNKPTADLYLKQFDEIVKIRQRALKDKLGLASHLLTPIQRLGKYVLMLQTIQKELTKKNQPNDKIGEAINMVKSMMRKGNDFIAIDSIKNTRIDLNMQGSFIMRAIFNIHKPRKFVSMVFLFDNAVVFTEKTPKNLEQFRYVDSIPFSDLSLGQFEDKPNIFHLTNYTKSKKATNDATYVLETEQPKMKDEWTSVIQAKLWSQLEKAKERQNQINAPEHRHAAPTRREATIKPGPTLKKRIKSSSTFYNHDSS